MQWLGSLLFTIFLFAWTGVYAIAYCAICPFLPFHARFALARFYSRVMLGTLRITCGLGYRVLGRENLPAVPCVALWKHSSSWETFAMMLICPLQAWVYKRELTWIPFFGWSLALMRGIPIDRGSGGSAVNQIVRHGTERLHGGAWVMIFPEGTRMAPGETRKYGVGGALLASRAERSVVPIAHDAGYYWGRRGLLKKRGMITVVIGKPIDCRDRDPREVNLEAQSWIESTIKQIREGMT
jgi:1-acyl-sn-glycerol-3-phosphate acyltransferase